MMILSFPWNNFIQRRKYRKRFSPAGGAAGCWTVHLVDRCTHFQITIPSKQYWCIAVSQIRRAGSFTTFPSIMYGIHWCRPADRATIAGYGGNPFLIVSGNHFNVGKTIRSEKPARKLKPKTAVRFITPSALNFSSISALNKPAWNRRKMTTAPTVDAS